MLGHTHIHTHTHSCTQYSTAVHKEGTIHTHNKPNSKHMWGRRGALEVDGNIQCMSSATDLAGDVGQKLADEIVARRSASRADTLHRDAAAVVDGLEVAPSSHSSISHHSRHPEHNNSTPTHQEQTRVQQRHTAQQNTARQWHSPQVYSQPAD
jgi:hypothetical protein